MIKEHKKLKVSIVSSGHDVKDDLIFFRYGLTLLKENLEVNIFAKNLIHKEDIEGIKCYSLVPLKFKGVLRYLVGNFKLFYINFIHKADINIICTPDLLPTAFTLKYLVNKKIIYNAQENYRLKFLKTKWIPKLFCPLFFIVERSLANNLDGIIVTDSVSAQNYKFNKVIILPNYPTLEDAGILEKLSLKTKVSNKFNMVYIGVISKERGLYIFQRLLEFLPKNFYIHIYGKVPSKNDVKIIDNSCNIIYHGFLNHREINNEIKKYDLGLCIFENLISYRYIAENTTKLFEYMKAGLPVVVSNFPGLKRIVEENNCGFCIDPDNIMEAANIIRAKSKNRDYLKKLGINGYKVYRNKFNWEIYKEKLINYIYKVSKS